MSGTHVLADRRHLWAFALGCVAVTAGVLLHLPMFWMGRDTGFRLADMPMDAAMVWGMALIVAGIVVAGYGLLPKKSAAHHAIDESTLCACCRNATSHSPGQPASRHWPGG